VARTKNPTTEQTVTRSIRIPVNLIVQIEQLASNDDRSVNWKVIKMLQSQVEQEKKIQAKK
jgi:hypothetical protein